jgi:chromatin assembly factor 1 subunit A
VEDFAIRSAGSTSILWSVRKTTFEFESSSSSVIGTHTKKSAAVGARTPFAQDPTIDYSYDSGDEWQDDDCGEDVDDFGEAKAAEEEEEEDDEEEDDEFADWLDDTEEDGGYVPGMLDGDGDVQMLGGGLEQSRLPMKVVKKSTKEVVKKVVKVVPNWKGPCWEERLGTGSEGLEGFRIQLLNGELVVAEGCMES